MENFIFINAVRQPQKKGDDNDVRLEKLEYWSEDYFHYGLRINPFHIYEVGRCRHRIADWLKSRSFSVPCPICLSRSHDLQKQINKQALGAHLRDSRCCVCSATSTRSRLSCLARRPMQQQQGHIYFFWHRLD